jgi:hypothetical protein
VESLGVGIVSGMPLKPICHMQKNIKPFKNSLLKSFIILSDAVNQENKTMFLLFTLL